MSTEDCFMKTADEFELEESLLFSQIVAEPSKIPFHTSAATYSITKTGKKSFHIFAISVSKSTVP